MEQPDAPVAFAEDPKEAATFSANTPGWIAEATRNADVAAPTETLRSMTAPSVARKPLLAVAASLKTRPA